jgi:hypothetical protein
MCGAGGVDGSSQWGLAMEFPPFLGLGGVWVGFDPSPTGALGGV